MTNQQGAPEALRLRHYVERRKRATQLDVNKVHAFDAGCGSEAELLLSDIETLLSLVEAQQPAPSAGAEHAETMRRIGEGQAFEAWFKVDCPVEGVNARIAAKAAWQARAALDAPQPSPTPQADSQPAPMGQNESAYQRGYMDGMAKGRREAEADSQSAPVNAWQQAIDHELVMAHLGVAGPATFEDARKALHELICWHIDVATDPATNGGKVLVDAARAPADSVTAPAGGVMGPSEPVFAFRRKGLDDFCTCTEERYAELSAKPNLFETRIFYTAPPAQAADSVLEDAALLERERICAAIKAEDDYCVDHGDYMLDSDDCIKIVRGEWVRPDFSVDAARKQGGQHGAE